MVSAPEVERICSRLTPRSGSALLARDVLNLMASDVGAELAWPLPGIDRGVPGLEDFCAAGRCGAEPGNSAANLLYYALTSPEVHPQLPAGTRPPAPEQFPTLDDFDALENDISPLRPLEADALDEAAVRVFAYQYRPASSCAHVSTPI